MLSSITIHLMEEGVKLTAINIEISMNTICNSPKSLSQCIRLVCGLICQLPWQQGLLSMQQLEKIQNCAYPFYNKYLKINSIDFQWLIHYSFKKEQKCLIVLKILKNSKLYFVALKGKFEKEYMSKCYKVF